MRTFLFWPDDKEEYIEIAENLQKNGNDILYWVCSAENEEKLRTRFPKTVFHNQQNAINAVLPRNFEEKDFSLPSKDLIEKFYKTESVVLNMMNKHFDTTCTDERKHIYYRMLGYWFAVFKKYSPELMIVGGIPHSVYNYIAYDIANFLGIKVILFDGTLIYGRTFMMNDLRLGSPKLRATIEKNKGRKVSLDELSSDVRAYYGVNNKAVADSTPSYVKVDRKKYTSLNLAFLKLKIIWEAVRDFSIFTKAIVYFYKFFKRNIIKEYRSVQTLPYFSKPFVYMALNYQPECTTSPQGDVFADLILAIETLSAALPEGWFIYAKEHPTQWLTKGINFSSYRYQGYYNRITKIKNVKLLPIETSNYELLDKSKAVASVTGTAAWEAVLREKPAIIFGYPWYQNCPMLLHVDSVDSCKEAFRKITQGFKISSGEVINFLKTLEESAIVGFIDSTLESKTKVTLKESAKNFSAAILEEINNFKSQKSALKI